MILGYYSGYHYLDLHTAFANVAWQSLYIGPTNEDPLVCTLSSFKEIGKEIGIEIGRSSELIRSDLAPDKGAVDCAPFCFVISGGNSELSVEQISKFVVNGSNLVVLYPTWLAGQYEAEYADIFATFGLNKDQHRQVQGISESVFGRGRVFVIGESSVNDIGIEPGPFGGTSFEGVSRKANEIKNVLKSVSTFNVPVADCVVRSMPRVWPEDHPLAIEIEVLNRSSFALDRVLVDISFPYELEPVTSTLIDILRLSPGESRLISCVVIPRGKRIIEHPYSITCSYGGGQRSVYVPYSELSITQSVRDFQRSSRSSTLDVADVMLKYERLIKPIVPIATLLQLLDIDPDAMVSKARKVGEFVARSIASSSVDRPANATFAEITRELYSKKIISARAKGYIDTVRTIGNLAAHPDESVIQSPLNREDALVVCHALILFLDEVSAAGLL